MELTILGSGGCMVIPKPLCQCRICEEARTKGTPYARTGPSAFIHDAGSFQDRIKIGATDITAIPVDRGTQVAFVYIFEKEDKRIVYAPWDIKPFPADRKEALNADLLVIQPGIFETGLKHGFTYPENHISRTTLYTFDQTMELAKQMQAKEVLFVHLEEYWNRGYGDYIEIEKGFDNIRFSYDGMRVRV